MSCLYSSPEVECTKMKLPWERGTMGSRAPSAVPLQPLPMLSTFALKQNAFPTAGTIAGEPIQPSFPA
jgi:hypothetical protein